MNHRGLRLHDRVVARHRRMVSRPSSLRLVLVRRRLPAAGMVQSPTAAPVVRTTIKGLSLVVAPRFELAASPADPAGVSPSPVAPAVVSHLMHRIERTVRQTTRHAVRVERGELLTRVVQAANGWTPTAAQASTPPVVERPPRMTPVRHEPAPPAALPAPPAPAAPAATEPGLRADQAWALTDEVMREIDRRIVAERERLGRLA